MYKYLILIFLFYKNILFCQKDTLSWQLITDIPCSELRDMSTDAIGNIYVLTDGYSINKYNITGSKLTSFTQNRMGNATAVDAGNALKVMVWYDQFRELLLLDRNLTQSGGLLNLNTLGMSEAHIVRPAADGHFWTYEEVAGRLYKISFRGEVLLESQQMTQWLDQRLNIQHIADEGTQVIAADTSVGFLIFNTFGQYQQTIRAAMATPYFAIAGQWLNWITPDGAMQQMNLNIPADQRSSLLPVAWNHIKQIRLYPGSILIWDGATIKAYQYD